ncbi:MAG: hypothetical protein HY007_03550 [Candidatus Sungbacteria bacterium]|nr:hypothetical protein [Candidatus Sungbacteria bacterium]
MRKKDVLWREILFQARQNKKITFTQKELAKSFGFSLSTVFNALKVPREASIITVSGRNFRLESYEKLLYLWASHRVMRKDIFFQEYVEQDAKKIESLMPPFVEFGLYSAFSSLHQPSPADYDHVYVYMEDARAPEVLTRLPLIEKGKMAPNLFFIKKDPWWTRYGKLLPEQLFVDIWNAPEWYAKDFLKVLAQQLFL